MTMKGTISSTNKNYQRKDGVGIAEEREESACSSKNMMQLNSDEDEKANDSPNRGLEKSSKMRETRNSCHVMETVQAK